MTNFCALAFNHIMIHTAGVYNICCAHEVPPNTQVSINDHDHHHWLKSDYVENVRESFLLDQRHPGCQACWQREDKGFSSLRTRTLKESAILPDRIDRPIKTVEVNLGNLCNLRCLMCFEVNSSAILAENITLGINKIKQTDVSWQASGYENLQTLLNQRPYVVNIRGGEPLFNKDLFRIVEQMPVSHARDMVLHITTNATTWSEKWQKVLAKFRLVRFMFSLDAIGELYEYIRYPATWQLVEQNIKSITDLPNAKVMVHCVAQNLNISNLGSLLRWCRDNNIYLEIDPLSSPNYLQIQNLPAQQKSMAIKHIDELRLLGLESHLDQFMQSANTVLHSSSFDPDLWQTFVKNISMRDNLRGNSFRKFIKED